MKHREAYYVLSEMHHLFLISPIPVRGKPSAVFALGLRWKNEEDGSEGEGLVPPLY